MAAVDLLDESRKCFEKNLIVYYAVRYSDFES